jgi:hypothetical protein
MSHKSDKHGPRLDDEMKHETEGMVRGDGPTHAEEFKEPEPVETDSGRDPTGTSRRGGAPPGMTPRDVENRSTLAQVLSGVDYPATPRRLAEHAADMDAPDVAVTALEELPNRTYTDLPDVLDELGHGREARRF